MKENMEEELQRIAEEINRIQKELKAAYVAVMILFGFVGLLIVRVFF
jgi:hypothetical protein